MTIVNGLRSKEVIAGIVYKLKVKVTLEQATKAQRGSRVIALLFP
jgi:hypothetical protein